MDSSTPFIQSGLASFRQPATIAVLASLGIHALFALNIEKIALFPNSAQLPPSVELMELSPDQVSGIYPPPPPKFSLSPIAPPSSLSSILGGGPTVPEFPSSPPPPSSPTFTTPQPELFTIPVNPSVVRRGSGLPSYPESYPESYPDSYSFGTLPPSVNIPTYTPPPAPSIPEGEDIPIDKNAKELERLRTFQEKLAQGEITFTDPPPDADIFNPQRISPDEPGSEPPRFPPPGSNNDLASADVDVEEPPSQTPPEEFRGSLLAKLEEGLDQEENTDNAANSPGNEPVFRQQQPQQPPQGQISEQERASIQGASIYVNWVLGVQQSYPNVQGSQRIPISDVYPVEACEQGLNGQVLVGVVVGSGGEILVGPELLIDTGYPVLDDEAVQTVREFVTSQASGGDKPTAYQYAFSFNSENCGGQPSSTDEMPPEVTPGNAQPAENNSTPGVTESENDVEDSVIPTSEDVSETDTSEDTRQPEVTQPDQFVEPDLMEQPEVTQPDAVGEPSEMEQPEVTQPEAVSEPVEVEPEVSQPDEFVEPSVEMEQPEVSQPDEFVEPPVEMEQPEVSQPDEFVEPPVEMEQPEVSQPDEFVEPPVEMEQPEVTQPEAIPNEMEQPLENTAPAESEELMN